MPISFLDAAANIYQAVEEGHQWPTSMTQGIVSTIPKVRNEATADAPSGAVLAGNGLDTRPIANLSFWMTAYSSIRYRQMLPWRETWLPPESHGARSQHSTHNNSWPLALANNCNTDTRLERIFLHY